jgi:hypothetical protein
MSTKPPGVLRSANRKTAPLKPVSIRIPTDLWEKCAWAAAAVGLDRTTFVRNALASVAKDAKPPADAKSRMILASDDEWRAWDEIAKEYNTTVDYLVSGSLNRLIPVKIAQKLKGEQERQSKSSAVSR